MNVIVPRTCTEIGDEGAEAGAAHSADGFADTKDAVWEEIIRQEEAAARSTEELDDKPGGPGQAEGAQAEPGRSRPLEAFRESAAYVLLGAPGAGKTEVFKTEGKRDGCHYVTARDFLTFDVDDKPEWHDTILFIDGLDERRAGAAGGSTPLDAICYRLQKLGRPGFRLSCREADWFGANDRTNLARVASDDGIKVLRLNPLSDDDIRKILTRNLGIEDADAFVATARERGIDTLLANPQNLEMLAEAVQGGTWPETRKETFELACKRLVSEHNPENRLASRDAPPSPELLSAAGKLCAVQLLTGRAGYVLPGGESDGDHLELDDVSGNRSQKQTLSHALGTRLFKSPAESRLVPAHRQIAEFLAARHLAKSVDAGLPVRRVLALMTGRDGGVVSELRGLSAWLAVHSKASRAEIVERDPLGTILYGDVRGFSRDEKRRVLDCLERETERNPWSRNTVGLDPRLGGLAAIEMEEVFRGHLRDPRRDDAGQMFVAFLLGSLIQGQPIPAIAGLLMEIARDDSRWSGIRCLALDAFIRHSGRDAETAGLKALLADVRAGAVSDPDDELLGSLLIALYPVDLSASEILRHLKAPKASDGRSIFGRYWSFWKYHVPEKSTSIRLGELLDGLAERFEDFLPVLADNPAGTFDSLGGGLIPLTLLARFLATSPEEVCPRRLFDWLGVASDRQLEASPRDKEPVRDWLTTHPDVQKAIVTTGVAQCTGSPDFRRCMRAVEVEIERRLFGAGRPADHAGWCLEQATAAADQEVAGYYMHEVALAVRRRRHDEGLSREVVEERIGGNAALLQVFGEHLAVLERHDEREAVFRLEGEAWDDIREIEGQRKRREWREAVTLQQAAMRDGRGAPALLEQLALAWFGGYVDVEGDTPEARLLCLLGDDGLPGGDDPIQVVLDAFRGTIGRPDVPDPSVIVRLHSEQRRHRLAFPFLAGMEVLAPAARAELIERDEARIRQAFAFHYTASSADRSPDWYEPLLTSHPGIAADILIELTRAEMRNGKHPFFGVYKLEDNEEVARLASLPLLDAFPVRCTAERLDDLSYLLRTALLHCDAADVLSSIDRKLARRSMGAAQRVYWLVAGLLASANSASAGSAASYRKRLEEYVGGNERRTRHLADFVSRAGDAPFSTLSWRLDVPALQLLVRLIGSVHRPALGPLDSRSDLIHGLMGRIASAPTPEATDTLAALRDDDALRPWRPELVDAADRQGAVRRDADFRHPGAARVLETLDNRGPANPADLAALTVDLLEEISRNIRDGNTNDWRQYWNQDSNRRPSSPKHEDDCRDALLSDLQQRMSRLGIDAAREGHYAESNRSDIRVSHGDFNVPVEIKKSSHRDLWSAIRNQLIAKYTRDPGAAGYGIYLVFWFGNEPKLCQMPESGPRPKSAAALEERLRGKLSPEEARLISVRVIDVARPGTCLAEGAVKRP